jgi:hypothetical protein
MPICKGIENKNSASDFRGLQIETGGTPVLLDLNNNEVVGLDIRVGRYCD